VAQARVVSFVLLVSENSGKTISYFLAAVGLCSFWKRLHQSAREIWQEVLLVPLHSDANREVIEVLFFSAVVAGLPINFKFVGEIEGENTIFVDLEDDWEVVQVLDFFTQGNARASDGEKLDSFDFVFCGSKKLLFEVVQVGL
jgi:hypothetical protein